LNRPARPLYVSRVTSPTPSAGRPARGGTGSEAAAAPPPDSALAPEDLLGLARLAAAVAAGDDAGTEEAARALSPRVSRVAVREVVLQTHLFAGFPASVNGFLALERAWAGAPGDGTSTQADAAPNEDEGYAAPPSSYELWRERGEALCARVYGSSYPRLRARMRSLSPELDEWMIVEGYGKTLSRAGLSAAARELCAVAALAARGAARQLEAHLQGARRLGLEDALVLDAAREAVRRHAPPAARRSLQRRLAACASDRTGAAGAEHLS
jgi:4-carboxymuconolactone decarboxylase